MTLGDVRLELQDSVLLAHLSGEIDLSNARGIGDAIVAGTPNHKARVIVDMSQLEYVDSAGIQLLYRLQELLRVRGQDLRLVLPSGSPAADALQLAGVIDQLRTVDTLQDALG